MLKHILIICLWCIATTVVAMPFFKTHGKGGALTIYMDHYVGDKPLQFDTVTYTNAAGQPFTLTKFKYYISNINLKKATGGSITLDGYYLVNEEDADSKQIRFKHLPEGDYEGVSFTIGVDSASNCSGAQSGALDPINGMFWAWNTGYIFLKLEGKSPVSTSSGNEFEFHIGGYKAPANCIRTVALHFGKTMSIDDDREVHIKVDASEVLKTPTTIDLSKISSVTDFQNATTIADNYADMFSVLSVK